MDRNTYKTIHDTILSAGRVLLISHRNPDGDTSGASLALSHYLEGRRRPHTVFCVDALMPQYQFLPGAERYVNDPAVIHAGEHDVLVVLDASDLTFAGVQEHVDRLERKPVIVNIDHHAGNTKFGSHNLVESHRASTTEIIFSIFDELRIPITPDIATCLLTGVVTDTGTFSNPATNANVMRAASRLMARGARVRDIMRNVLRNKTLSQLLLWGRAFARLKENPENKYISTVITQEDLRECHADEDDADGVANFLGGVSKNSAIIVLREQPDGLIKGSLRTTSDLIDVSRIATLYGGGGHAKAAGFTVKGSIVERPHEWSVVGTADHHRRTVERKQPTP